MVYLTDSNVLLGIAHGADTRYPIVQAAVRKLWVNGHELQTTSQNFSEFWNVSIRPIDRNGFGLMPYETDDLLRNLEQSFPLLMDSPDVYPQWRQLVVKYNVSGAKVHDTRLVATMLVHDVTHILTSTHKTLSVTPTKELSLWIQRWFRYTSSAIVMVHDYR